jgi:hypothetical protein
VTVTYLPSDPTVVTVGAVDPANPYTVKATSTGKVAADQTIGATMAFKSGAPSLTGTSPLFDVPAGPPASLDVNLGVPA